MRRQGVEAPIWSIRNPRDEPNQDFPAELDGLTEYLPDSFSDVLQSDRMFRRQARKSIGELCKIWDGEGEKRRVYEALWLLPHLREQGISHVHTHFAGTAARTAFWLKKLGNIRYSFTAHANDIFCDEPHERLDMLIKNAECVVTVSDFSRKYLCDNFTKYSSKVFRVYNGIYPSRFQLSHSSPDRPLIVAIGRYIEKKGFGDLIAACRKLGDRNFDCVIVGEGPLEQSLRDAAAGDSRIQIAGPKCEAGIIELLARATVLVLPCVDETGGGKDNLPTVIMEAMAAGLPVISTPVAGVPEMVADGETGYLVPPRDPESLAGRLTELLDHPERALEMGRAGRRVCEEKFATERTTAQLREILSQYRAFEPVEVLPPAPSGWAQRLFGK